MRWRNCWQMISISAAVGTGVWNGDALQADGRLQSYLGDHKMPWNWLWGNQWTWKLQLFFSTLPDVEKVSEEPSFFTFGLQTAGTMIPYCHAFPWAWDTQLEGGCFPTNFRHVGQFHPTSHNLSEAWNAKWLWNLFSFLSCDRHRIRGWREGVDCDLHAGGGVGCNHTMDVWWDILVVLQTLRAPSFWNPPDFAEKSQALSKRGRRMDHRDLVAGAQVRVLHGAWSLARLIP